MKTKEILNKKETKNMLTMFGIVVLVLPILAFANNASPAFHNNELEIKDKVELKTGDVFDLDLLFNEEVNDVYYDITFENQDASLADRDLNFIKKYYNKKGEEVSEKEATYAKKLKYGYTSSKIINSVGTFHVSLKNVNNGRTYDTNIVITDGMGPKVTVNDKIALNGNDFLTINDFIVNCEDESSVCDYKLLNENNEKVDEFDKTEGVHNYVLNVSDAKGNITKKNISYTVDNTLPSNGMRVYYSASGFSSDNPIVRDALMHVGETGLNCEQLFQLVMRNNQELKAKTGGDINSVRSQVDLTNLQPGDELRYADGGWGMIHVAIYLGDGLAVHGGFHGTDVVIFDAFPEGASIPTAYHYNLD